MSCAYIWKRRQPDKLGLHVYGRADCTVNVQGYLITRNDTSLPIWCKNFSVFVVLYGVKAHPCRVKLWYNYCTVVNAKNAKIWFAGILFWRVFVIITLDIRKCENERIWGVTWVLGYLSQSASYVTPFSCDYIKVEKFSMVMLLVVRQCNWRIQICFWKLL